MDLEGAPECPAQAKADARDLSMFKDKEFGVAFVAHVFECIPERLAEAVREVHRVADLVWVAHVPPESFSDIYNPEIKQVIYAAPPEWPFVIAKESATGRLTKIRLDGSVSDTSFKPTSPMTARLRSIALEMTRHGLPEIRAWEIVHRAAERIAEGRK